MLTKTTGEKVAGVNQSDRYLMRMYSNPSVKICWGVKVTTSDEDDFAQVICPHGSHLANPTQLVDDGPNQTVTSLSVQIKTSRTTGTAGN
jgi:hypothetical protein